MATEKAEEVFASLPFAAQRIGGMISERMQANVVGRLLSIKVEDLTAAFLKREAGTQTFVGEHAGKFLDAACNVLQGEDDRIVVRMGLPTQIVAAPALYPGHLMVQRGPQILSFEKGFNPQIPFVGRIEICSDATARAVAPDSKSSTRHVFELDALAGVVHDGETLARQRSSCAWCPLPMQSTSARCSARRAGCFSLSRL